MHQFDTKTLDCAVSPKNARRQRKAAKPSAGPPRPVPTVKMNPPAQASAPSLKPKPPDDKAALDALLTTLEAARERPAIVYWTSPLARMSLVAESPLFDQLSALGKTDRLDLVLFTNGGDTEAPWRLVSLIREFCGHLSVLVPHRAASSGTLLAMGANEIVMSSYGTLGPIDPSRRHPLLPRREGAPEPEPISVQDMRHAMQFIKESPGDGTKYTPEAMAEIFKALFEKIHPLAIGAIEQSYALAKLIGAKCLGTHMDPVKDKDQITAIVDVLCDDFKSHQYPISRREAKAIGLPVVDANQAEESVLLDILKFYTARPLGPFGSGLKQGTQVQFQIAWMDSLRQKLRVIQDGVIADGGEINRGGDRWITY